MLTIWMIWSCDPMTGSFTLEEAWDDDTVSGNDKGWEEAKQQAYEDHGPDNIRIIKTSLSYDKIAAAFMPVEV